MNGKRTLRLRRDVLLELTDAMLASVAGADAATRGETWCVLCITYFTCPDTCTVPATARCAGR
jgi:hypothetical protein